MGFKQQLFGWFLGWCELIDGIIIICSLGFIHLDIDYKFVYKYSDYFVNKRVAKKDKNQSSHSS